MTTDDALTPTCLEGFPAAADCGLVACRLHNPPKSEPSNALTVTQQECAPSVCSGCGEVIHHGDLDAANARAQEKSAGRVYIDGQWAHAECALCEWKGVRWKARKGAGFPNALVVLERSLRDHIIAAHVTSVPSEPRCEQCEMEKRDGEPIGLRHHECANPRFESYEELKTQIRQHDDLKSKLALSRDGRIELAAKLSEANARIAELQTRAAGADSLSDLCGRLQKQIEGMLTIDQAVAAFDKATTDTGGGPPNTTGRGRFFKEIGAKETK